MKTIDEDGEYLITKEEAIMERLRNAKSITGWILDDCGNKDLNMDVFDWDGEGDSQKDIPDIIIQGNRGTIFHDELKDAKLIGNTLTIGSKYLFEIQ
jgi:hypothetical protein